MKRQSVALAGLCLLSAAAFAAEDELSFSAGLDFSRKTLTMSVTAPQISVTGPVLVTYATDTPLWSMGISPTISYKRLFASVSIDSSLGAGTATSFHRQASGYTADTITNLSTTRSERSATVGYNIWGGLSLFAGRLVNTTERQAQSYTPTGLTSGDTEASRITYTEKGPYAGIAYSHAIGNGSINASVARLNGNGSTSTRNSRETQLGEGTVRGNSFGIGWTAPLTQDIVAKLGYRSTRYKFSYTLPPGSIPTAPPTESFTTTQQQEYEAYSLSFIKSF